LKKTGLVGKKLVSGGLPSREYLCALCKGVRRLCGRPKCPILERAKAQLSIKSVMCSNVLFGSSPPSLLVGEYGYPKVKIGPMVPPEVCGEEAKKHDNPPYWYERGLSIEDVIRLRATLVRGSFTCDVREPARGGSRFLEAVREIALSFKPVDAELKLKKPPRVTVRFDGVLSPTGPSGVAEEVKVVDNPFIPRKVDALIEDGDVKAFDAVRELYLSGFSVYDIIRIFSLGLLGKEYRRRLVPTRWAITAVDSMVSRVLLERVKEYGELGEVRVYHNRYIGNTYVLMLLPGPWSFEMVEIWLPRTIWARGVKPCIIEGYELYNGVRKPRDVDGGYDAIRISVLEFLNKIKRQATVIALREVGKEYYAPLGSWQIRESVKHAFDKKPMVFSNVKEAVRYVSSLLKTPVNEWVPKARLLKMYISQRRLTEWQL